MIRSIDKLQQDILARAAYPLSNQSSDYDPLMDRIGDARVVLIGEASHGTHDFYHERAEITKRLIAEKGFNAIAVEADWPDAYRVDRFVRGVSNDESGEKALANFRRFPTWMWRNNDVLRFLNWLQQYNESLSAAATRVGFYGLDLYSMYSSIDAVINYLDTVDSEAAQRARHRYACFDHFGEDSQQYGYAASLYLSESCENEAVNQLLDLQQHIANYAKRDGRIPEDEHFYAEQNARLVANAEEYYRNMFRGRVSTWNLRDQHMMETLNQLLAHLEQKTGTPQKIVVWAHNSHLGDARATEMGEKGELNVGQLVRSHYGHEAVSIGFSTFTGTVAAASKWGEPVEIKQVRPGLPDSYESLFHNVDYPRFMLLMGEDEGTQLLQRSRIERAIGVIYLPETERISHYFFARLPQQFDALIHIDTSRAVEPLEQVQPEAAEPETFPSAL